MTLDDIFEVLQDAFDSFIEFIGTFDDSIEILTTFFSIQFWVDLLTTAFSDVFNFFSKFSLDHISTSFSSFSKTGDLVLSTFFNLFSSFDISDFLLIFVGFIFSIYVLKTTIHFIRG